MNGYDQSLTHAHSWRPLHVEGALPPDLRGTLYRNGPLSRESVGAPVSHMFEADGGIAAVRFDPSSPSGVQGATRILDTRARVEEQQAGRPLYGYAAPWLTRTLRMWRGNHKNAANTHVIPWQGKLWALYEGGLPTEVDPQTLDVLGETTLDGVIPVAFSAHPHAVAGRDALFNFGLVYGRETRLDLFRLSPAAGGGQRIGTVRLPHATMLHDFAVTERHLVFFVSPIRIQVWRALLGLGPVDKLLQWAPQDGTEVIVVPIADPHAVRRFVVEPFYQWHFANAFERGNNIVIDYCRYPSLNMDIGGDGRGGQLTRAILDPQREALHTETIASRETEFPRVHPSVEGHAHERTFTAGGTRDRDGQLRYRLCRFDASGAEAFVELDPGQHLSEPVLAPRSARERDAWLLSLVYDEASHRSFLWIVDADTMQEQARCWFEHHVPRTFHGSWIPTGQNL